MLTLICNFAICAMIVDLLHDKCNVLALHTALDQIEAGMLQRSRFKRKVPATTK
jgi:hypothetical protein